MSSSDQFSMFSARLRRWMRVPEQSVPSATEGDALEGPARDAEFGALALELYRLQFEHNAPYRRWCEAEGAQPDRLSDWTQIPAIPAAAFKELDLSCLAAADRTVVFHSSGTTGQRPSRHYHNASSLAVYEASLLPWFATNVLARPSPLSRCPMIILSPPPAQAPHSSLVHMFETVRREFASGEDKVRRTRCGEQSAEVFLGKAAADGAWALDLPGTTAALEKAVAAGVPVLLLGTAFLFVQLLDYLAERGLRFELPIGSRVMETGGYKGRSRSLPKEELHSLIAQRFGLPPAAILCEYGMSELSSQAYDPPAGHPPALPSSGIHAPALEANTDQDQGSRARARGAEKRPAASLASAPEFRSVSSLQAVRAEQPVAVPAGTPERSNLPGRAFRFPPWARVRVISPETGLEAAEGETGLIRAYDLANVYSVLAIQTEDLGTRRGGGFILLGRAALSEPRGCSLMAV